ncbi:MAG TPA: RnfH family protein [Steroidobacteraceae bacterium]|nr:RnfH family protein [Steroidobacteraceae bacterium]
MSKVPAAVPRKRCTVAWAARTRQHLWSLELQPGATIADALAAARRNPEAAQLAIPWDTAEVGVFGEPRLRHEVFADGDRIELYRPLRRDPREQRRERVQRERRRTGN